MKIRPSLRLLPLLAAGLLVVSPNRAFGSAEPPSASTAPAPAAQRLQLELDALPALPTGALATPPATRRKDPTFHYDIRWELPVTAAVLALLAGSEIGKARLVPGACRLCATGDAGQSTVNGLDRSVRDALRVDHPRAASITSDVIGFGVLPAAMLGLNVLAATREGGLRRWAVDALLITESVAVAGGITQIVKFSAARERPYLQDLGLEARAGRLPSPEDNLSFFSGHTSMAFALAVSSGTVATLRHDRHAPAIWATGLALAATTGYLRIAADKHHFTDVLVGAAVGSAVGVAVPWLHLRRGENKLVPTVSGGRLPGGGYVTAGWTF